RLRHAVEDDAVPAGTLELGAPAATGLRLTEAARERGLRPHAVTAGPGHGRAGEDAGRDDQDVVGPERIGPPGDVLQQVVRDHPPPAGIPAEEDITRLLHPRGAIAEVHVQHLVPVPDAVHGPSVIRLPWI